ncbi:hypothetical protein Rhopal_007016-T1 [Rhodotorula paludigena]|uniref:VWFA domain-containing protein n=1 Tax=Rhodotorula paludigena TaxID=86838 RepID=A0AAV5GWT5_9BASI|nr:hypothetical protein Rhopal_007016-T1 [Rhodotorula paludigena]
MQVVLPGLAAKLAAAQANQGQYGSPYPAPAGAHVQQGYAPPPPQQGQYGQQGGYAPPPGPPPAQQGGYAPPPPPQQPARPAFDPTRDVATILRILEDGVKDQNLSHFYKPGSLQPIAQRIAQRGALATIAQNWQLPLEIAMDMARLALFDTMLLCDDSASMSFAENGSRIDDLKLVLSKIRWLNSKKEGNNINSESQALELVSRIKFDRATPLGTSLRDKILEPLVYKKVKKNTLKKPALIVIITDGAPTGEPRDKIVKVIQESKAILGKTPYTPDAVGNDAEARDFLEWIDKHPQIGSLVDCTSNYEQECDDMAKGNPPVHLTPTLWLAKLLGPIHSAYDAADEGKR